MARVLLLAASVGYVFHALAPDVDMRRRTVWLWTGGTLAALGQIGLFGIMEYLLAETGVLHFEPGSFYRSSVGLAVHIAFFSPLALGVALGASRREWRLAAAVSWVVAMMCLPLTASRGAIGSVFVTSVLVVLATARRTRGRAWRGIAAALVLLAAGLALLAARPEIAGEAFAYKYRASVQGDFFSTRVDEWREAWAAIKAFPIFGEGPEAWAPSVFLELARRHGLPAALLAVAAIVAAMAGVIRRVWHRDRDPEPTLYRGLHLSSAGWGVALGLIGLLLVGLAETGVGARTTPLLAVMISVAGMIGNKPGVVD
jgi:O-antigen ligase